MSVSKGILGKHPAFGDFVQAGFDERTSSALSLWLDRSLSELKASMGAEWPRFWDQAQGLRFWIGEDVVGYPIAGVMLASRDQVNRAYPLICAAINSDVPAPVAQTDQGFWVEIEAHLQQVAPQRGSGGRGLLEGWTPRVGPSTPDFGAVLSAHRPDGDLNALLRSAKAADALSATRSRSYWWASGDATRAPVWLSRQGLPEATDLGWLMAGVALDPEQIEKAVNHASE